MKISEYHAENLTYSASIKQSPQYRVDDGSGTGGAVVIADKLPEMRLDLLVHICLK